MATSNPPDRADLNRNRVAVFVLLALALVAGGAVAVAYFSRPPQMGTSEEAFRTVDALYTAVRNRDEKRLTECEQRLAGYRQSGQLPANAADELAAIIVSARSGSWETAAERLYGFMRAQRREGAAPHPPKVPNKQAK
ncbi:MAG TPA: hypothetical protein VGE74_00195 [Gemmata sp.]